MKTNSNQSSLSQYGYDMVVAVTQGSVNKVMKHFMSNHEQKEYLLVLKRKLNTETETYTYETVDPVALGIMSKVQMLLDTPATKSERTPEEIVNYQDLYHNNISYVCKAQLGINQEAADTAPNIIQLDKSDIDSKFNATFHPIFKEFNLIRLYSEDALVLMQKEKQPKNEIWEFSYNIKLNYKKDIPFEKLPQQVVKDIKDNTWGEIPAQYSTLFDIRALYADFTTAMVQQYAPNIESNLELKQFVQTFFEDYVLKDLREQGDEAIFSYSIKPETGVLDKLKKSLVIPASYKYYVSPYINENGEEQPDKKDLYTINYIVMEKDKQFPELRMFTWNWVEAGEEKEKNGCMAVNSGRIIQHLQDDLKEVTKGAYLIPSVDLKDKFLWINIETGYKVSDCPDNLKFIQDSENKKQYQLSYTNKAKDGVYFSGALGIYIGVTIEYLLDIFINLNDTNQIVITIKNEGNIELQTGASHSKGRMVGDEFICTLTPTIDLAGNLTLNKEYSHKHFTDDIDHNVFVDIFCMGTDRQCIDSITEFTSKIEESIQKGIERKIGEAFDNKIHWVLPGGDTFIFKSPVLSEGNDLVVDLTYKEVK